MKLSILLYLHKILFVQYTSGVFQDMAENKIVYKKKEDLAERGVLDWFEWWLIWFSLNSRTYTEQNGLPFLWITLAKMTVFFQDCKKFKTRVELKLFHFSGQNSWTMLIKNTTVNVEIWCLTEWWYNWIVSTLLIRILQMVTKLLKNSGWIFFNLNI